MRHVLVQKREGKGPLGRPRLRIIILKWKLNKYDASWVEWIDLVQGRDKWRVLVTTVK